MTDIQKRVKRLIKAGYSVSQAYKVAQQEFLQWKK